MKYLILIYTNQAGWERLTDAQRADFGRSHTALSEDLAASGELVVSEGLADPALAKIVSLREGRAMTTDGPFAEVKEHLAGFYLIECESMERAIELAAQVPDAAYGQVELRPVLDRSGLEM